MSTKRYSASGEDSEEDKCLHGKILGLENNLILYEGNSLDELKEDFEAGVESYLDRCKRKGFESEKPYNGGLNIRVPSGILQGC
jgi:predicted HicB family RNase H-like nuclease